MSGGYFGLLIYDQRAIPPGSRVVLLFAWSLWSHVVIPIDFFYIIRKPGLLTKNIKFLQISSLIFNQLDCCRHFVFSCLPSIETQHSMPISWKWRSATPFTTSSCHNANFVVGCHTDFLRCHQWQQNLHHYNSSFSVLAYVDVATRP